MITPDTYSLKTALISVSDKSSLDEFAKNLHELGIIIYSTGGTEKYLQQLGIPVHSVSELTGFPEILDGRLKTLHPNVHGGLLGCLDDQHHIKEMAENGISSIDLLVVNLYPFEATLEKLGATEDELIENIDIGGPTMLRAAAKNFRWTLPVTSPEQYAEVIGSLKEKNLTISIEMRKRFAASVFATTSYYDTLISNRFLNTGEEYASKFSLPFRKIQSLRYGENPHQRAALYGEFDKIFRQIHGKELSYNNILDIDAGARIIREFDEPTFVIIKHTNPCGVATSSNICEAYDLAFATDTVSPFGGIFVVNREIDKETAQKIHSIFSEVIIAPSYTNEALELLCTKRDRRLISIDIDSVGNYYKYDMKSVVGAYLMQDSDKNLVEESNLKCVTKRQPTDEEWKSLMFGWKVCKHVKSNAIVYSGANRTLGIGAGQMSRVDSSRIAVEKAKMMGLDLKGSTVASDAFFPFADGVIEAVNAGSTAVIQPGGSVRDEEVIKAADDNNISMIFTGMRHFRH